MSGISTGASIALVEAKGLGGMDIETYKNELDCVLALINNGRLGKAVSRQVQYWGSDAHATAVKHVIEHAQAVAASISEQQLRDAQAIEFVHGTSVGADGETTQGSA